MWQMFKVCFVCINFYKIDLIDQYKFINDLDKIESVLLLNKN